MRTWQIPEWTVTAALCGVLVVGVADLIMLRRHSVTPHPQAVAQGPRAYNARPSPFESLEPEIVVTKVRREPVEPVQVASYEPEPEPEPVAAADSGKGSGMDRLISKIPLLRRWQKHPPADENGRR